MAVWQVNTATYVASAAINASEATPEAVFINASGADLYYLGQGTDRVYQHSLTTPWDIKTSTYVRSFALGTQDAIPTGLHINESGASMYIIGSTNDRVYRYNLSTPWNISTASFINSGSVKVEINNVEGVWISASGSEMYAGGSLNLENDKIVQYRLSTPFDPSTLSVAASYTFVGNADITDLFLQDSGAVFYKVDQTTNRIHQFTLSTPWNISTASETASFSVFVEGTPTGVTFAPSGSLMYVIGSGNDRIVQYKLAPLPPAAPSVGAGTFINIGDAWKNGTMFINVGDAWKNADPFINIGDAWKNI